MAHKARVYKTSRGRWEVRLWWRGRSWNRYHYDDKYSSMPYRDMAERIAHAIDADIEKRGRAFDPRQWFRTPGYEFRFDKYAEKWLERKLLGYAPSVRRDIRRYVGYAISRFGMRDIREINDLDLELFLEEGIPGHLAPKTKHVIMGHIRKVFRDAKLEKMPEFPKITLQEPEVRWINKDWQEKILHEIPKKDRGIFHFMTTYGVRPGEARALQWGDVDFENDIITIRRTFSGAGCNHLQPYTKTHRIRHLPLTEEIRAALKKSRGIAGFVYRNSRGRPYTADLSRIWNEARDKAGAPRVTLYQGVRHSFATQHLDNLDVVRQVLGHTNVSMTRRYQGINMDKMRELVDGSSTVSGGHRKQ